MGAEEGSTGGVRLKAESGEKGEAVGQVFEGFKRTLSYYDTNEEVCLTLNQAITITPM